MKRTKKPAVKPQLTREWLRRCEEDGESPPQIAQADHYDVRTVRKQLEVMRQEREIRQARQVVLRQALEKHYADICSFAKKMRAEMGGDNPSMLPSTIKDDPMWRALRQHLPRSPLWKDINKLEGLVDPFRLSLDRIKERVRNEAISRTALEFVPHVNEVGLFDGLPDSIAFHLQNLAQVGRGLLEDVSYTKAPTENGVLIQQGAYSIALVPEEKAEEVMATSRSLLNESTEWQDYAELYRLTRDFVRAQQSVREELTTMILRRVVPGKCKYCPF